MLRQVITELVGWIAKMTSDIVLCEMLEEYLGSQGEKQMQDCLVSCSTIHQMLVQTHDRLGLGNFVEDRICKMYLDVVANAFSR